jgi:hypothetical protein
VRAKTGIVQEEGEDGSHEKNVAKKLVRLQHQLPGQNVQMENREPLSKEVKTSAPAR